MILTVGAIVGFRVVGDAVGFEVGLLVVGFELVGVRVVGDVVGLYVGETVGVRVVRGAVGVREVGPGVEITGMTGLFVMGLNVGLLVVGGSCRMRG